jgi:hypothetical protein
MRPAPAIADTRAKPEDALAASLASGGGARQRNRPAFTATSITPKEQGEGCPSWLDLGAAHFLSLQSHGKSTVPYPTQDVHTPAQEAEFIAGFHTERRKQLGLKLAEQVDDPWVEGC